MVKNVKIVVAAVDLCQQSALTLKITENVNDPLSTNNYNIFILFFISNIKYKLSMQVSNTPDKS